MFRRLLVANRGEIAVRVIRACHELGISPIAVYSDADRDALHVQLADRAIPIGPPPATESYLDVDAIVTAARSAEADAIHPGYGFLSENPAFAKAVSDAGIMFIGPTPETIELAGDKIRAREEAREAGVPVLPAVDSVDADSAEATRAAETLGLPLLVKAAAGGGGKGMRIVRSAEELTPALESASREAASAFGDGRLFLERMVERPRHVEVQILADATGAVVHLGERECSLQRRHQKVIEEAPSPVVDGALRERLSDAALRVAKRLDYRNAGTVEFLLTDDGEFFFLEVNPRLQVEHPVTELVTGVDLVAAQIRIASGEPLSFSQDDVELRGHAIEARLYAEDPRNGFLPSSGRIENLELPAGPGLRIDSALIAGGQIPVEYDPLLAKMIAFGSDRESARRRLAGALGDFLWLGPPNNSSFLRAILESEDFATGAIDTQWIERQDGWGLEPRHADAARALAALLVKTGFSSNGADRSNADRSRGPWESIGSWRLGAAARRNREPA